MVRLNVGRLTQYRGITA